MKREVVIITSVLTGVLILALIFTFSFNNSNEKISGKVVMGEKVLISPSYNWNSCTDYGDKIIARYKRSGWIKRIVIKNYSDKCLDDNQLRDYSCYEKKPYYINLDCENGCEGGICLSEPNQDDSLMEQCAIDCNKEKCDEIFDTNKKKIALEQYSINCDESSCQDNSCAKKIAIIKISMDGSGTEKDPYQIKDCLQLESVGFDLDANYILANNIDCVDTINWDNGKGFEPIGLGYFDMDRCFEGKFNGNGYIIYNLFIGKPTTSGVGLFGCIYNAELKNLILINSNINGGSVTGGLVGKVGGEKKVGNKKVIGGGTILNSVFNGRVTGRNKVGGIAGENYGLISDSYSSGNMVIEKDFSRVGGLVGFNYDKGIIQNSYSTSEINGQTEAGGLAGYNSGTIKNSFFAGNVYGSSNIGFLAGNNYGKIQNSSYFNDLVSNLKCAESSCTQIQINKGYCVADCYLQNDINYFKGSVKDKEPFKQWDFVNNWKEVKGDYPLKGIR